MADKRLAKHMPSIISPWLPGSRDPDIGVARTAQEALAQTFPSSEKRLGLWKVYQANVLDYCSNVVNTETVHTLSDERSTTTEDAEALYSRVLASSIGTFTNMVHNLDLKDMHKCVEVYSTMLGSRNLWSVCSSKDAQSQKSMFRLLENCLAAFPSKSILTPRNPTNTR